MTLRRRDALILGGAGIAAAAAGLVVGPLVLQSRSGAAELLSARFPDLSGRQRSVGEWSGRILVCNFWATWCPPCVEEIPLFVATRARFAAKGVEFVGIAVDNAENVRRFLNRVQVTYPLLISGAAGLELVRRLGNPSGGLPYTVVLDRAGSVAETRLGAYEPPELEATLRRLTRS